MPSAPVIDERNAAEMAPLPNRDRNRARRLVALYAILALLAVVVGIVVGVYRHNAAMGGSIAAPTEHSLVATALPGLPTPTPLAAKPPTPTAVPPSAPPPTVPLTAPP
ncbi:MAG: hypothetical protein M3008_06530, partial [Chloroflexota bacterium]|nr:hypothetical protein [Chloroflexota bacterium]